ncbi:MAG: hypothetical protein EKK39_06835 [Sphingobacteriales bacterium]|uniref:DUF6588 family protein n=1 Tax=Hydrotalea flava TaxID=714549 RepID=UPI00082986DB|nr:DUF6588 family protein [Hydrotalea flava]RTL52365.1 MAG: hypothetical protein EKK39_06835 [Sphingobacteriales bacterium]
MKKIALLFITVIAMLPSHAQGVAAAIADANKFVGNYLQPFGEGEIYNMNRGWYSTARAHKLLGFDLSVSLQAAVVPTDKQNFTFNNADYSTFKLNGGATSASLPTFMGGSSSQSIHVNVTENGQQAYTDFTTPTGIGNDFKKNISFLPVSVPLPVAQLGIGIFKHTDLKVRYFPKTDLNNVSMGIFGIGVQHEFSNYLPFLKKVPFLHLSALAAYNHLSADYYPNLTNSGSVRSNNADLKYDISAYTVQAIASVKFSFLEIYTAIGYNSGKSNINVNGSYQATLNTNFPPPNNTFTINATDPLAMSYTASGISNTWGVRFNLFILKIYADYTFAKYNGIGAGVAFAFR